MKITQTLIKDYSAIPVLNRVLLIENALTFAYTGYSQYDVAFSLLQYLHNEKDYLPWYTALTQLKHLDTMLKRSAYYGNFQVTWNICRKLIFCWCERCIQCTLTVVGLGWSTPGHNWKFNYFFFWFLHIDNILTFKPLLSFCEIPFFWSSIEIVTFFLLFI